MLLLLLLLFPLSFAFHAFELLLRRCRLSFERDRTLDQRILLGRFALQLLLCCAQTLCQFLFACGGRGRGHCRGVR